MPIPVFRPLLPTADKLLPYLKQIDANRYYTNYGPLIQEYEHKLAAHFGLHYEQVFTCANGTLALTQTLLAFEPKPGALCAMPSWTFVATAGAAVAAGMTPFFVDVRRESWALHPSDVEKLLADHPIGAVIVVAPFGGRIDIDEWYDFQKKTGIPVIIDAAAGFDSFSTKYRRGKCHVPVMVSLHATKVCGIGEGAVIMTEDEDLAVRIFKRGNFGFWGDRQASIPGFNAKISEYAAAVGLAAMEEWPKKKAQWQELQDWFAALVAQRPYLSLTPDYNQGWSGSYGIVQFQEGLDAQNAARFLADKEIATIAWWNAGCHTQPAYRDCPRTEMTNTDYLAKHSLGLPFWIGLTQKEMTFIFESLDEWHKSISRTQS